MNPERRRVLAATATTVGSASLVLLLPLSAAAQSPVVPAATQAAMDAFTAGAPVSDGGVELQISELVENGNLVPVTVRVDSPMTPAQHVRAIALFTERNPQPEVAVFHLHPAMGRAQVGTRIRLATSQTVTVLAQLSDGRCLRQRVGVIVTLAACVEG
jgi:sulfur-oxidizing protein SoxY